MNDTASRADAVRSYAENLVVVAGAGTGKTSLLVERVLNQLIETDLQVTELAAITFTEKAAAQMRTRLEAGLARLVELAEDPGARAGLDLTRAPDRAWAHLSQSVALDEIGRRARDHQSRLVHATISTVHGFCSALLRQFPVQAGVDPDFRVDDGLRFDGLRAELWQAFLDGPHGPEGEHAARWERVLTRLDTPEIEALAQALAAFDVRRPAQPPALPDARIALGALVAEHRARIDALLDGEPARGPESFLAVAGQTLQVFAEHGTYEFRQALERAEFEGGRSALRGLLAGAAPTSKKQPEATLLAAETHKLLGRLERIDDALLQDALELVYRFGDELRAAVRERGVLPFDALLAFARDMLAEHPAVRRQLAQRYRALFVDEFQDTDPVQYEIVFYLAEDPEGEPAQDAFDTRLARGKLFIVGDPKQAIYRFRGADIQAYHRAVKHVQASGGRVLELTTSWRAVPEILEPLDRLFPTLLGADRDDDAFSGYHRLESGRLAAGDGARVEVWTVGDEAEGRRAAAARRDEAGAIAAWIAEKVTAEELRCGDVALLFRSLRNLRLCTRALAERGVPFSLETGRGLLEHPEGQQLWALLRALASPADAPALLGMLRSPLGAATDAELAAYAAQRGRWSYLEGEPDAAAFPNVARCFAWLAAWHETSLAEPLDRLLTRLCDETVLLPLQAAATDGAQRLSNLRSLLDPLIELARAEPEQTLASLVPWLERGDANRRALCPDGDVDAVRIMSIHAAKGLEFPVVILSDLGRDPVAAGRQMGPTAEVAWQEEQRSYALQTPAAISSGWLLHERDEARHADAESKRLFYVACTRAQERLILVHAPRKTVRPTAIVSYLQDWGYPPTGLPADQSLPDVTDVATRFVADPGDARLVPTAVAPAEVHTAVERARAAVERARTGQRAPIRSVTGLAEEREARLEREADSFVARRGKSLGREVGLVVHDVLERWDFRNAARARELLDVAVQRVLRDHLSQEAALRERAGRVLEALLAGPLPAYLAGVEVLARELPLLYEDDSGIAWSGTLDLLYLDGDGRPVVADYKTDREPDAETEERYRAQLETYGQGVRRAFPDRPPPALELIYVRSGLRVRLAEPTMPR